MTPVWISTDPGIWEQDGGPLLIIETDRYSGLWKRLKDGGEECLSRWPDTEAAKEEALRLSEGC